MTAHQSGHPVIDECDPITIDLLRSIDSVQKFITIQAMWASACAIVRAGIRAEHPDWPDDLVLAEQARRMACPSRVD